MDNDTKKSIFLISGIVLLLVILFSDRRQEVPMPDSYSNLQNSTSAPQTSSSVTIPDAVEVAGKKYVVTLKTTKGDIVIAMNTDQTPNTVANFVTLAKKGFYNNVIFHRAINGFMIQGGDPTGTGSGGPGYKFADEPFTGEYTKGTVAMANAGPNTNGSQFFIMHTDYALPKNYTIFGHVIKGIEVVDAIATDKVETSPSGEMSKPVSPTKIVSAEVTEQ